MCSMQEKQVVLKPILVPMLVYVLVLDYQVLKHHPKKVRNNIIPLKIQERNFVFNKNFILILAVYLSRTFTCKEMVKLHNSIIPKALYSHYWFTADG